MPQVLWPLRLNCPWRACAAAAAMVRSTISVPAASIGAVQLAASMLATSTSIAALPACTPTFEPTDSLYVALRIDTLIYLTLFTLRAALTESKGDTLTPCPEGQGVFNTA